jgi:hypothetical protein
VDFNMETGHLEETMPAFTRTIRAVERPGRLQLAIVEWQRQLLEMKRQSAAINRYRGPLPVLDRP